MEKGNKICFIVIVICAFLVIGLCVFAIYNHDEEKITDAIKFKDEYELLNDVATGNGDYRYPIVSIDSDNPIVYKTPKEILEVLEQEDAVIYFGFATCPWCRNVVETLINVAKDNDIEKVYYVDIKDIRDTYEFNGTIEPKMTKKGTKGYYDILDFFGDNLDKYYVKDEDGNQYDTGVTRLYAPTVVSVSDGEVLDMHVSTVVSHINPYEKINKEQQGELKKELENVIKAEKTEVCEDDKC